MIYKRQKILLQILKEFGREITKTDMQKYLLLYVNEFEKNEKSYHFIPYKYGCFSLQSYRDKESLKEKGIIENADSWRLINNYKIKESESLTNSEKEKIKFFKIIYGKFKGDELIKKVYLKYPYYAINSSILSRILTKEEIKNFVKPQLNEDLTKNLYTIGYEGISIEEYINKLIKNNIKVLCDVRKNPFSRKYGFSKGTLSSILPKIGIEYVHIPELGIESEKRQNLNSLIDYKILFKNYDKILKLQKIEYLKRIVKLIDDKKRVALTCFEKDFNMCHRYVIAKNIKALNLFNEFAINL